jgi:hypothetical protein
MRATFITLAIDDGADADIIEETRVTHTRKSRNAFDGYHRGLHWDRTCAEIAKLRITRGPRSSEIKHPIAATGGEVDPSLVTLLVTASTLATITTKNRGGGGSRIPLHLRSMTL